MSKSYDISKRKYNQTNQLELQKLMIKLLIVRVADKIVKEENRQVVAEYF